MFMLVVVWEIVRFSFFAFVAGSDVYNNVDVFIRMNLEMLSSSDWRNWSNPIDYVKKYIRMVKKNHLFLKSK